MSISKIEEIIKLAHENIGVAYMQGAIPKEFAECLNNRFKELAQALTVINEEDE